MLDKIAQGHAVDGMEALSPALVDGMELLVELLPPDTHVLVCDPELVRGRAIDLVKTSAEFLHASWAAAAGGGKAPIDLGASAYQPLADVRATALARGLAWWTPVTVQRRATTARRRPVPHRRRRDSSTSAPGSAAPGVESRTVLGQVGETYRGDTEAALNEITKRIRDGWRVVLMAEGKGMSNRIAEVLAEHDLPVAACWRARRRSRPPVWSTVVTGELSHGFVADEIKLAPVHRRGPVRSAGGRQGQPEDAGPAQEPDRPAGAEPRLTRSCTASTASAATSRWCSARSPARSREYLVIEYAPSKRGQPGDRLYVPMDALDQVTRYVGGENPSLDKMGGGGLGQAQGPGPQGGPRDRRRADQAVRGPAGDPRPRVLRRHRPGSASSRTPSTSSRPPTSWPRSRRSSATWSRSCRWTG